MADHKLEFKTAAIEFKASGEAGEYEGHFSIFGNVDDGQDVVHPGAFQKTIQERGKRVKVFYAHDWMKLIGPAPDVLEEDALGLFAKGRLTISRNGEKGSFWADETWALMKDNALNEGSFGYEAVKFDFENASAPTSQLTRHLRELKLYEISPVPLGMNALTQIRAVKAALTGTLEAGADPLDFLTGKLTALTTSMSELKEGRTLSATSKEKVTNAVSALEAALEALHALLAAAEPPKGQPTRHSALLARRLRLAGLALQR